jgi:DNA repair/transcription protein MET18/MMS19
VTLWDALKFEVLNVQEEDLAEGALKVLTLIGGKFALQEGHLNAYLKPIIIECNQHLEDAPTKQSSAAGRILHAIATAATPVADKIAKGVIPVLFTLYQATDSLTKRRGLLEVFNEIVRAYLERFRLQPKLDLQQLSSANPDASGVMIRALNYAPKAEVSFRLAALAGIAQLVALRGLLTEDQNYQAVDVVTEIILHEHIEGHGDIRDEAIKTLASIAHSAPDAVRNRAIPAFMVELPDVPSDTSYPPVLEAFAQLSSEQQVFDTVVLRLRSKYNAACAQNAAAAYQQALLLAILFAFTQGSPMPDEEGIVRGSYYTEYVEALLVPVEGTKQDTETAEIIGRLCNIILRPQGVHFQNQVYNKNFDSIQKSRSGSQDAANDMLNSETFSLFYYAALRAEVVDPEEILSLLQTHSRTAVNDAPDSSKSPVTLQHISLITNKFMNPKTIQGTLESAGVEAESLVSSASPSPKATGVAFAIVKALLIQGKAAALTSKYLQLLLQLLSNPDGKSVARRFGTLLAPDEILIKENHCQVSGLYKQKTFSQLVPSLTAASKSADATTRPNYLIALSGILRWLPYSMLESSLTDLVLPLLQTLDLSDQDPKASTLTIFESVLMHNPEAVSEHTASLITRLLNCTTAPVNTAKVRAKGLQCLALVPKQLKTELVVPYRRQVVKKLMVSLDDKKRDVRAEAVRCRSAWLGLDEGQDDE